MTINILFRAIWVNIIFGTVGSYIPFNDFLLLSIFSKLFDSNYRSDGGFGRIAIIFFESIYIFDILADEPIDFLFLFIIFLDEFCGKKSNEHELSKDEDYWSYEEVL
eukprot:CAMPEP_0114575650 /NCGR_PEP_ID=MMETSP0125-20121206/496_1 /TAXON_ID=485358 ORGANISM="Aristerostoma sp., Strain ATCC 50986" /NCGR_SAMPLE_ID=MMETSP0125 /ASSEMBLY_ACC=CAM_ASM_000245 /LENGTH=106 /DNA_ID=CAMNT_0001763545 /DNA_START=487 /DNA_END=807 /DNA_ORIENTATION=-